MAILINTDFQGVRTNRGNPAGPIVASDVAAVAGDHGLIMEVLTNKKGDNSGGTATTSGHAHGLNDGEGNLIFVALATQDFGPTRPDAYRGTDNFQGPPRIFEDSGTTPQNLVVFFKPFFVPRGFEDHELLVIIESYGSKPPSMTATLSTWGTASPPTSTVYSTETPVTGQDRVPFLNGFGVDSAVGIISTQVGAPSADLYVAVVTPADPGIHTIKCEVPVQAKDTGDADLQVFTKMTIVAAIPADRLPALTGRTLPTKRIPTGSTDYVEVGDVDSSSGFDYEPVYDSLAASNEAMGPTLEMANRNSAVIEEWARGIPASGNTALTVAAGHQHTVEAANPYGKRVEMCLGSWSLGSADTGNVALAPLSRVAAPMSQNTTLKFVASADIFTPKYTEASTRMYGAVLVRAETGKSLPTINLISDPNNDGLNTQTAVYTSTGTTSGYQLITSSQQFTMKSGGITGVYILSKLQSVVSGLGGPVGFCFFIDE